MQRLLKRSYASAFQFGRASGKLFEAPLAAVREEAVYAGAKASTELGLEPVYLERAGPGLEVLTNGAL